MKLVTGKWYRASDYYGKDDDVYYNYLFEIDANVLYFSVKMSEYVGLTTESLDDFIESVYNNYVF